MVGFGDGGFQWWLDFRGGNSVVVGLGWVSVVELNRWLGFGGGSL